MPVQTAIQVRRGTASSWTSTNPTLAAGEIGFETDTGRFKIGTGSAAWNSLGYFAVDPVTTKGDLYTFSTTDARLPVGANGDTLVADSASSVGLRYQPGNGLAQGAINGGFDIWQRGTSSSSTGYLADRWFNTGGNTTYSQETSAANLPTGFRFGLKMTMTGTNTPYTMQAIETSNAILFAGRRVVLSYFVSSSNSADCIVRLDSSTVADTGVLGTYSQLLPVSGNVNQPTTTSMTRVFQVYDVPANALTLRLVVGANANMTSGNSMTITGVQLEVGSVPTTFRRAGGTIQGEIDLCKRYYYKTYNQSVAPATTNAYENTRVINFNGTTVTRFGVTWPLMRTAPSVTLYNPETGATASLRADNSTNQTLNGPFNIGDNGGFVDITPTGGQYGRFHMVASAEL